MPQRFKRVKELLDTGYRREALEMLGWMRDGERGGHTIKAVC